MTKMALCQECASHLRLFSKPTLLEGLPSITQQGNYQDLILVGDKLETQDLR
jgi:hypothetical protein